MQSGNTTALNRYEMAWNSCAADLPSLGLMPCSRMDKHMHERSTANNTLHNCERNGYYSDEKNKLGNSRPAVRR
jgi:hypothetical protein